MRLRVWDAVWGWHHPSELPRLRRDLLIAGWIKRVARLSVRQQDGLWVRLVASPVYRGAL